MKTILITGSTDGIGKETAKELAQKGHRIIIHGRSQKKVLELKNELDSFSSAVRHKTAVADLESQRQILNLAVELKREEEKVDVLINNAAIYQKKLEYSEDQIEKTIAVNYHSHFILSLLIIPLLKKSADPRLINFSSMVHSKKLDPEMIWDPIDFSGSQAYSDSKLAMLLFTFKLDRLTDYLKVNALHPGVINTKLLRKGWGAGGASVKKGAETPIYLALSDEIKDISGSYFVNKKQGRTAAAASREELQDQLWQKSFEMIKYQEILNQIPDNFFD